MAKPLEDLGHAAALTKPLRLKRYRAGNLPDAGQCTDCLIIINDQHDGIPRARVALSNGATWDHLAWLDDLGGINAAVPTVDVSALAREAVNRAIAEAPQPAVKLIAPSGDSGGADVRVLAQGLLEASDHLATLAQKDAELEARMRRIEDLESRIEYIERHALAKAEIA